MTKDERRALARINREKMMAGDEKHLLPRDRGKVRAYVRDLVDTRRNVAGILLPIALLSFVVLLIPIPIVQAYGPLVLLVGDRRGGHRLGHLRSAARPRRSRPKFPNGDSSGPVDQGLVAGLLRLQPGLPDPPVARPAAAGRRRRQDRLTRAAQVNDEFQRAAAANADAVLRRFFDADGPAEARCPPSNPDSLRCTT